MTRSPQRLVCVTTSGSIGGAEASLLTLLAAFRALEPAWDLSVIAPSPGPLVSRAEALGVAAAILPHPRALATLGETGTVRRGKADLLASAAKAALTVPGYLRGLRRMLADRRPTIVHSNGLKAHLTASMAAPRDARLVWHLHDYVQSRPFSAALLRRLAGRAGAIVANSDSVQRDAMAALRLRDIRRVYNAIDLTQFTPAGTMVDLPKLAGLPSDESLVRIGLVATFARWKGHGVFIDALSRMRRLHSVRAYIVGGPVYRTAGSQVSVRELMDAIRARGLEGRVGFTGHVGDMPAAIRSLDVVVHASTSPEPFGMVIAEAMASARAVVAARAGGAAELFDDGVNAVGHVAGDAEDLAAKLDDLAGDPARRAALGTAARTAACCRFDPRRMAGEFREAYLR